MTEVQALQAEATRQDAIAQALRADVRTAEAAAAGLTLQAWVEKRCSGKR